MSYAESVFMAEEIARQIKIPNSLPPTQEPVKVEDLPPSTADIINHNLNNANQWYEIKLPRNLLTWQIRARQNVDIRYSYSPTHTTYFTLKSGEVLGADTAPNANLNAIYVMCETAGTIIELEFWKR